MDVTFYWSGGEGQWAKAAVTTPDPEALPLLHHSHDMMMLQELVQLVTMLGNCYGKRQLL